jgi:hypothetical protein
MFDQLHYEKQLLYGLFLVLINMRSYEVSRIASPILGKVLKP